ncbi:MAG TPA: hypothetical protein VGG72_14160 [Bryobacteraceae bacterium]|jgi:hypothetical protein
MRASGMVLVSLFVFGGGAARAVDQPQLSSDRIEDIIQKFAAKESEFAKAREAYTYRQTARIQTLDDGGKWETDSDIVFDSEGKRTEHVVFSPVSTLELVTLTPEDMEDLRNTQPFVLTSADLPKYYVRYLGKQAVDEITCYVFAVKPKKPEPGQRYFEGEVWVDDHDLQIVKSYGRGMGANKKKGKEDYPKFETYREQIDGKYWFPTYTTANSVLHFKENDVRLKETVRYENYKQFKAQSTITFSPEDPKDQPKDAAPAKKP